MTELITSVEQLPPPECEGGYPWRQLTDAMDTHQLLRLQLWMEGQTMMLCDGRTYNHDTSSYEVACDGVAHGPVVYAHDLYRFIGAGPIVD